MANTSLGNESILTSSRTRWFTFLSVAMLLALVLPNLALAQDATGTIDTTCKFATNINKILNAISIVVVTIAVVFSGYQIAFAHKRIGDVAPILIGGLLIGAAGQIAKMLLGDGGSSSCAGSATGAIMNAVQYYSA